METERWNVAKGVRGRDAKSATTNRDMTVTIGRDEASATRSINRKGATRKEMRFLVGSRSLGTIIKMSTRTVVVMVTNGIYGVFAKDAIGVENMLQNLNVANGARRGDSGVEKELINGRGGGRTSTLGKMRELRVVNVESRIVDKGVVDKDVIGRRHARDLGFDGVDTENVVGSEEVEKTVIIVGGRQMRVKRRRLI